MKTCFDCIHFDDMCKGYWIEATEHGEIELYKPCTKFRDKDSFVEVVRCDVCLYQGNCIVESAFDNARFPDSKKFCAVGVANRIKERWKQ